MPKELREYQKQAISEIENHIFESSQEACLLAPTSFGKSMIICELAKMYQEIGVVILVNISSLIEQLSHELDDYGVPHNILKADNKKAPKKLGAKVTLAMQQTLSRRENVNPECGLLIVDERHISFGSKTMAEIERRLKPANIVGLSATPLDSAGGVLDGVKIIKTADTRELTEMGWLVPVRTFVAAFSENIDFSEVQISTGDYNEVQLAGIINTDEYNREVVSQWKRVAGDRKTIVFASGIDHAESLASVFSSEGIPTYCLHSKNEAEDNAEALRGLKSGEYQVVVSVSMISTGFSEPSVSCAIMCRPTKVKRLFIQCVGRIMRLHEGKHDAIFLDFAQVTGEHGFYDEPFELIDGKNKKAVKASRIKNMVLGLPTLLDGVENAVEVPSRSFVEAKLVEIKQSKRNKGIKELIELFEMENDVGEIIAIALEIDTKMNGRKYKSDTASWIASNWRAKLEDEPDFKHRWTKALKTRAKNIIQSTYQGEPKKMAGLYYFIDWLYENRNNGSYYGVY